MARLTRERAIRPLLASGFIGIQPWRAKRKWWMFLLEQKVDGKWELLLVELTQLKSFSNMANGLVDLFKMCLLKKQNS